MKTSVYLLAIIFIPTAPYAYMYRATETTMKVTVENHYGSIQNISGVNFSNGGGTPLTSSTLMLVGLYDERGKTARVTAGNGLSTFQNIIPSSSDHYVTVNLDGRGGDQPVIKWSAITGELLASRYNIPWGAGTGAAPNFTVTCDLPGEITSNTPGTEYQGTVSSSVKFTSPTNAYDNMTIHVDCSGRYVATASIALQLKDDVINLTGTTGTRVTKESEVRVKTDPGRVRLTIQNSFSDELTVSFEEDNLRDQTEITFTDSGEQNIPFYVGTTNTAAGVRMYTVSMAATYL